MSPPQVAEIVSAFAARGPVIWPMIVRRGLLGLPLPAGFPQEGSERRIAPSMILSGKDSVAWGYPLNPEDFVVIGASAPVTSTLGILVAAGRLSSRKNPVAMAMVNGYSVLCLVYTGSGCTMVSTRVVMGSLGRMVLSCRQS